jgi:hypothetical protein
VMLPPQRIGLQAKTIRSWFEPTVFHEARRPVREEP